MECLHGDRVYLEVLLRSLPSLVGVPYLCVCVCVCGCRCGCGCVCVGVGVGVGGRVVGMGVGMGMSVVVNVVVSFDYCNFISMTGKWRKRGRFRFNQYFIILDLKLPYRTDDIK